MQINNSSTAESLSATSSQDSSTCYSREIARRANQSHLGHQWVVERVARGTITGLRDRVRDLYREIEDGILVCTVEAEVLADRDLSQISSRKWITGNSVHALYVPLELFESDGAPSPTRQSGHSHFTCLTVLPDSCCIISPKLAFPADAVPFDTVKFFPVV